VPAVATREIAIRREVIAGLSQLAPPQKLASSATGVIRNLNAQQARARAVKRAAEHNDGAKLSGIEDRGATSLEREAIEADDLGLSDCAQI
jgi:hypothetical protein